MSKVTKSLLTVAVGAAIWIFPMPAGVTPQAWHLLAIFIATIVGFILNPLPIGAIAFTSISLTVILKILKPGEALSGFADTTVWLIVAAFLFAKGFIKTGLGRRIAYSIMHAIGDSTLKLAYALMLSDVIIAPATPSNTARAGGILFPIVRSLASAFGSEPDKGSRKIGAFLMVCAFQVNCVTSTMFLTSMSPNPLIASLAAKAIPGMELSWGMWALTACVPAIFSLIAVPYVLYKVYPPEIKYTPEAKELAADELEKMGPMSNGEKIVSFVFVLCLILWATASFTNLNATNIAMIGVSIMLWTNTITWNDVIEDKAAWDAMIWMGSLVCLAGFLTKFGLVALFAKTVSASLVGIPWLVSLLILLLIYMYSHYFFASTSAHVTAMYAAFLTVAVAAGAPPYMAAFSLAFISGLYCGLTHYGNGPASIYFGAGFLPQGTFWKLGFIVSLVNITIWLTIGPLWWKVIGLW
ncbi:MAG TPA: anion permease [Negativicutes bacterium]|nr:anion permease [Negativicutes bacterium]